MSNRTSMNTASTSRSSSTSIAAFTVVEEKKTGDELLLLDEVIENSRPKAAMPFHNKRPLPPPGFHPDFMFCGECTTCGSSSPNSVVAASREEEPKANNKDEIELAPMVSASSTTVRSTFHVSGICCASEVPAVRRIAKQLEGVTTVHVNIPVKRVYIQHASTLSAEDISKHYTAQGFPASILQDGNATHHDSQKRSNFVETTLLASFLDQQLMADLQQLSVEIVGVRSIQPHLTSHTVKVEHDPKVISASRLCEELSDERMHLQVLVDGFEQKLYLPEEESSLKRENEHDDEENAEGWTHYKLKWNVALSGIFWVVSMIGAVLENASQSRLASILGYAGILSVVFGLPPVAKKAFQTIRRRDFDANCMMVIAGVGALALGEWDEAASVSFLFAVSELLESRATRRARQALSAIVKLRPERANLIHPVTKEIVVVSADAVPVGSLISVRTGDKIAADGVVVEGTSAVDESSLTGESTPVRKTVDSLVSGGSINIGSTQLVVKTTSSVEDSAVSRLIRLVEESQANRSPTEKTIDGFARAYTPVVVVMASLMATIPWLFGAETGHYWTLNALIIIVIACPCALTISTPVTYAAGLAATAQKGIVVKGGAILEAMGSVETIIFDKTGTLTEGNFSVTCLEQVGATYNRKEMLGLLALMEAPSSHPLSATLVNAAKREGVSIPKNASVQEHRILIGEGVEAIVNGKRTYVGNKRLFERLGMFEDIPDAQKKRAEEWSVHGGTVGFLGVEGDGILSAFCVTDKVRSDAKDVIESLLFDGINVVLLTGDGDGAARAVATQLGLSEASVHSQLLPEDKLHYIGAMKRPAPKNGCGLFRRHPRVLFVGDGVNDAPALSCADIGISVGEGAALAIEVSDVTLMDSSLSKLLFLKDMGCRVMYTVQENIILSLFCKLAVVALTFGGYMTLLYAIASDVGVMLLVTLNGMKLLPAIGVSNGPVPGMQRRQGSKKYDVLPLAGSPNADGVVEIV